ncbi:MAG: hypothetical protein M9962_00740 [Oligoflexia bacterium]|nr:hypothetical protein [Oligoflexia bacterium]
MSYFIVCFFLFFCFWHPSQCFALAPKVNSKEASDPYREFLRRKFPKYYQIDLALEKSGSNRVAELFQNAKKFCDMSEIQKSRFTRNQYFDVWQNTLDPNLFFMTFKKKEYMFLMWDRLSEFGEDYHLGRPIKKSPLTHEFEFTEGLFITGSEIAGFFNLLNERKYKPTAFELSLAEGLLKTGNLKFDGSKYSMPGLFAVAMLYDQAPYSTIEHEINHAVMNNTPRYAAQARAVFGTLTDEDKKLVSGVLGTLSNADLKEDANTFYYEFTAYFRDPEAMVKEYGNEFNFRREPNIASRLQSIKRRLRELEEPIPVIIGCGKENPNAKALDPSWVPETPSLER